MIWAPTYNWFFGTTLYKIGMFTEMVIPVSHLTNVHLQVRFVLLFKTTIKINKMLPMSKLGIFLICFLDFCEVNEKTRFQPPGIGGTKQWFLTATNQSGVPFQSKEHRFL